MKTPTVMCHLTKFIKGLLVVEKSRVKWRYWKILSHIYMTRFLVAARKLKDGTGRWKGVLVYVLWKVKVVRIYKKNVMLNISRKPENITCSDKCSHKQTTYNKTTSVFWLRWSSRLTSFALSHHFCRESLQFWKPIPRKTILRHTSGKIVVETTFSYIWKGQSSNYRHKVASQYFPIEERFVVRRRQKIFLILRSNFSVFRRKVWVNVF